MTFRQYFYTTISIALCIIMIIVSFNICMNEYGLFGNVTGKSIKIWHNERTSKYLLSYNYIPANFEGILIGSSVSDNLDTKKILGFKIYNASIGSANISELKYIADNIIERGNLKFIVLCLYPYTTKDHGRKTSFIDPQEYWSSLGSWETFVLYYHKIAIMLGLTHDLYNDYGYKNFNLRKQKGIITDIKSVSRSNSTAGNENAINQVESIDEIAYAELGEILKLSRKRGIKIFAFYYPYYIERYNEQGHKKYKAEIDKLFDERDILWNLNGDEYLEFRKDVRNYYDKGHLSWAGANYLVKEINNRLNSYYGRCSNEIR